MRKKRRNDKDETRDSNAQTDRENTRMNRDNGRNNYNGMITFQVFLSVI